MQAYALTQYLRSAGHTVQVINYRNPRIENSYRILKSYQKKTMSKVEYSAKYLARVVRKPYLIVRRKRFEQFFSDYYHLTPPANSYKALSNADYDFQLPNFLEVVALNRLNRRIERGQQLLRYLPTKKFASIRVIRSPAALKILAQLLTDENSLTDKIFIYDEENWTDLLNDVTRENLPHLVIVADYDVSLISAVENRGLRYGEHVISFRQEYLKRCEKLFHSLGK